MWPAFTLSGISCLVLSTAIVHASPLESRAAPNIAGYSYQGCYTEATNTRALNGSTYFDDQMTVEKCAAACSNYVKFGLEYGRECYCGDSLNAGSVIAPAADCSFACPGNSAEACGASRRLNLYQKSKDITIPPLPTFTSQGCYTDSTSSRALTGALFYDDAMTVEKCAGVCAGWVWFGVEYSRECYCGNAVQVGSVAAPAKDCSFPCPGNTAEFCGAGNRLNLYKFAGTSTIADPTSNLPSSGSSKLVNSLLNGDFQSTDPTAVYWVNTSPVGVTAPAVNFMTPSNSDTAAHVGSQMASILFKANNYAASFEQSFPTNPLTTYTFSAWTWAPTTASGCSWTFYVLANGLAYQAIPGQVLSNAVNRGSWIQTTGTFMSLTASSMRFHIQLACTAGVNPRTFYVDDVFIAAV